jgi:hypothetical protein
MLGRAIAQTRDICQARLRDEDFTAVRRLLETHGKDAAECWRLVARVTAAPPTQMPIEELKALVTRAEGVDSCLVERFLLIAASVQTLDHLVDAPVSDSVKQLCCDEFQFFANPDGQSVPRFAAGRPSFAEMCKTATLRRFPAGQFDWEVSGISKSDLLRVETRALPRTLAFVIFKMRGLWPVFFSHLNPRRKNRSLDEVEASRSYYKMAKALELQPAVKGFGACSWFRSPATHRVSPHLAWMSRVFLENGGLVVEGGRVDPDCGVLYRSATRKQLYDAGRFTPRVGLVMWPRNAMIAWAKAHPEYA